MTNEMSTIARAIKHHDLAIEQQEVQLSKKGLALCIRTLMQNWRQGTVACKDRGEVVSRSNKKPWKQKGTGRARAGSPRSPLWRGGGVVFGPQERVRTLKVTKAIKRSVFNGLLHTMLSQDRIFALDWQLEGDQPKTAQAYNVLKQAQLHQRKILLFVDVHDIQTQASFANLANVRMLFFDQPNAYALADSDCWVFLNKDTNSFKEMAQRWL